MLHDPVPGGKQNVSRTYCDVGKLPHRVSSTRVRGGGRAGEDRQFWPQFLIFASLAHIVFLCFSLAPPYLALSPPISPSSPFRAPLFPSGRGGSVSWAGPRPWLRPWCAECDECPGGGLRLIRMEMAFPRLECWPCVGAGPIFPDTVYCEELCSLCTVTAGLGWGSGGGISGFLLPIIHSFFHSADIVEHPLCAGLSASGLLDVPRLVGQPALCKNIPQYCIA